MRPQHTSRILIVLLPLVLLGTSLTPTPASNTAASMQAGQLGPIDGQVLFAPFYSQTTYLLNRTTGDIDHTWSSAYQPFTEAYWLGNGTIMRPILGGGGGLQKILWDGTLAWDYRYTVSGCTCHHDIKCLPNGNVLMIVWETKTKNQAIQAGRDPSHIQGTTFTPDKIIEVQPTGPTSGEVVWEWHVWDHLIQDYDDSKDNYGVVGDHPELMDVNFGDSFDFDWLHVNSLDYNATFDQILVDCHNFDEVWVIDHSTTTEEAAGHTGGHYGHGGDLLYRWGNPQSYDRGTSADRVFYGQHDATWIPAGYPGAGDILVFNNGLNRPGGQYSTIEEFTPPIDADGNYDLEPGAAYAPEDVTWRYTANPPTSFYSHVFSSATRLKDGDTLICSGIPGKFFEVTPDGTTVWQYSNPYPSGHDKWVFKIEFIPPAEPQQPPINNTPDLACTGSMSWSDIKPGATVHGSFQVQNIGDPGSLLNWTVNNSPAWGTWTFTPSSGEDLTPELGPVTVQVSLVVPDENNQEFRGNITVVNADNSSDSCTIPVILNTPLHQPLEHHGFIERLLLWFPHAFPFLRYLFRG